jgi:TonB family protein
VLREVDMRKSGVIDSVLAVSASLLLCGALVGQAFPPKAAPQSSKPEKAQTESPKARFYYVSTGGAKLKLEHRVDPVYPPLAKMARIQGNVALDVTVEPDGNVSDVKFKSGHPLLVRAALDAVRQWKYAASPQLPATISVTVQFRLPKVNSSELESGRGHFPDVTLGVTGASKDYPEEARRDQVQGQVLLQVTADQESRASDFQVLKTDSPLLTDAAVRLLKEDRVRWKPGINKVVVAFELNHRYFATEGPLPIAGRLTQAPEDLLVMRHELALYPEDAQKSHLEGDVEVQLTVDEQGEVTDATVVNGPEPFRAVTLEAAKKWRFAPPSQAPVDVTLAYHFWIPD